MSTMIPNIQLQNLQLIGDNKRSVLFENKQLIFVVAVCMIICFTIPFSILTQYIIALFFVLMAIICRYDNSDDYNILLFSFAFNAVINILIVPFYHLIAIIIFLKRILFKRMKVDRNAIIVLLLLIMYEATHIFIYELKLLQNYMSWCSVILCVSMLIIDHSQQYNHKNAVLSYVFGLFTSSICGINLYNVSFKGLINSVLSGQIRYGGMLGDPNYYGVYIVVGFCFLINLYINSKNKFDRFFYIVLSIILQFFGILGLSRSFLLTFILVYLLLLLYVCFSLSVIAVRVRKFTLYLILFSLPFILKNLSMINNLLQGILKRFDRVDLSSLTNSRSDLIIYYWDKFINYPLIFLFGFGVQKYNQRANMLFGGLYNPLMAHNAVIEALFTLGILGSALFVFFIYKLYSSEKNRHLRPVKPCFVSLLPIIAFFFNFMSLSIIGSEICYIIVILLIKNIFYSDIEVINL